MGIQEAQLRWMPKKLILLRRKADPNQYRVVGFYPGHAALIRFENGEWQILHTDDPAQSGEWIGNYECAEDALAALEKTVP